MALPRFTERRDRAGSVARRPRHRAGKPPVLLLAVLSVASCDADGRTERAGTPELRAALFDTILARTERREAFSPLKEAAMSYRPLDEMAALRDQVVAADTEEELYYALVRLSNARRDHHLSVTPVAAGLRIQGGLALQAPVRVLGDFTDPETPEFFVSAVDHGALAEANGRRAAAELPIPGDRVVAVDGRTIPEFVEDFEPYIPYSSLHGRLWDLASIMTHRDPEQVPPWLYDRDAGLTLELERDTGERVSVTLPYVEAGRVSLPFADVPLYPGFTSVLERQNFHVLLPDDGRPIVLLRWLDFEDELVADVANLIHLAEARDLLGHTLVIDVTGGSGGSGGAYAIQRLVSRPFKTTFGNIRLSDAGVRWVEERIARGIEDAPTLDGYDLSGRWLVEWLTTDVQEAIARGDEYSNAVPFKSAHLPKGSDGTLSPADVHFRGPVAILNGPNGGSHLDQFVAMFADNGLAVTVGMPAGGYSNTWEATETISFPGMGTGARTGTRAGAALVDFMWNIGHTLRPNGQILEGNPAEPQLYIPLTRANFRTYHQTLLGEGLRLVRSRPVI